MKLFKQSKQDKEGSSSNGGGGGGFTLIEVVLVLAIGGLIFLLAFLAFGQATKNRRDTQRRSDAARIISEIENAKGDSGSTGTTFKDATSLASFVRNYLGGTTDTSFESNNITYTITYGQDFPAGTAASTPNTATAVVYQKRLCSGNAMTSTDSGAGDYAVLMRLEKGVACKDNK